MIFSFEDTKIYREFKDSNKNYMEVKLGFFGGYFVVDNSGIIIEREKDYLSYISKFNSNRIFYYYSNKKELTDMIQRHEHIQFIHLGDSKYFEDM